MSNAAWYHYADNTSYIFLIPEINSFVISDVQIRKTFLDTPPPPGHMKTGVGEGGNVKWKFVWEIRLVYPLHQMVEMCWINVACQYLFSLLRDIIREQNDLTTRQSSCVTARGVPPMPLASGFTCRFASVFTSCATSGFTSSATSGSLTGSLSVPLLVQGVGVSSYPVPGLVRGGGPPIQSQVWLGSPIQSQVWLRGPLSSSRSCGGSPAVQSWAPWYGPPCGQAHKIKTLLSHTSVYGW